MRTRRKATIEDLRRAIDCLPHDTKIAMLDGIRSNPIIAGAYTDGDGICPMLAAHRFGGRTSFISFAHAWDRFAFRDSRIRRARRATRRELLILTTHLQASLLAEEAPAGELAEAIAEHQVLVSQRPRPADSDRNHELVSQRPRPGDPDRSRELRDRPGWAWTRVVRRYDDYERALTRLRSDRQTQSSAASSPAEPVR